MALQKIVPGTTRIGWIGTGVMGASMCGHLIGAGFSATVFNRTKQKAQPLIDRGARWADTPRAVADRGWATYRYSGLAFRVEVVEADGATRFLDVFGGFLDGGRLYLMGEVGHPFEREWLLPLGTTTLRGREYPAPARPEKLLEVMYGPSWEVPDPVR